MDDELVCFLPLVGTHVHFKSLDILTSLNKELLSLVVFANLGVVPGNLNLVRSYLVGRFVLNEVNGTVPVASRKGRLDGFVENSSLDKMIDSLVELAL